MGPPGQLTLTEMNMTICKDNDPGLKDVLAEIAGAIDPEEFREFYRKAYGKETTLTGPEIIRMCARSDDDMDEADWAKFMKSIEDGTSDVFATMYNTVNPDED